MADIADLGSIAADRHLAQSLARQQSQSNGAGKSYTHCADCGEPIAEKRRQAVPGCTRCVTCQAEAEK